MTVTQLTLTESVDVPAPPWETPAWPSGKAASVSPVNPSPSDRLNNLPLELHPTTARAPQPLRPLGPDREGKGKVAGWHARWAEQRRDQSSLRCDIYGTLMWDVGSDAFDKTLLMRGFNLGCYSYDGSNSENTMEMISLRLVEEALCWWLWWLFSTWVV